MSGSATVAGSKRTNAAASEVAAPAAAAAAAAASASRVTTRSQARAMASQPPQPTAIASFFALRPTAPDAAAAAPASSSSAAAAAAAAAAPVPAAAAAAASSPPSRRSTVPHRRADPPSLFSANSPDPLSLILSFALIDLPVATGQPYFPKELVRIVHEYASEACFIVQLESVDDDDTEITHSISFSSSAKLLKWLGAHLPDELRANTVGADDGDWWIKIPQPEFDAYCDCCLMDEELKIEYGEDISLLLHAQLRDDEYRMCYLEIQPHERDDPDSDEDEEPVEPADYAHEDIDLEDHSRFCVDGIEKRKTVIQARGQKPVAVGLNELLKRVRLALWAGRLPDGLSPRPCDWAPLFRWIREFEVKLNEIRADAGNSVDHSAKPVLSAVLVRSTTKGAPVSIQGEACLWSSTVPLRLLMRPAASMMIDESDDDAASSQPPPQFPARFAGLSPLSSAAPRVSSLSADEESAARAAPRRRR